MKLREERINEIRNINLIYVYQADSIFKNNTNKYVGIKVVYNNNSIIDGKYNDNNFALLVKKVIERYNKEKNNRKIILLGDLTKKLINSASFHVIEEIEDKKEQIPYYECENKIFYRFKNYLEEAINTVMKDILKFESFKISSIDGFNHKYKVNYTLGGQKYILNLVIFNDSETLYFKTNYYANENIKINGRVEEKLGAVEAICNVGGKYKITLLNDVKNNEKIKHIESFGETLIYEDNLDTILEEDIKILDFYFKYMNISNISNILKINDKTYIANIYSETNKDDELLYKDTNILISIDKDTVRITTIAKDGFSKYDDQICVLLDKKICEVIFRKYNIGNQYNVVIETNDNNSYTYKVLKLKENLDLNKPFDLSNSTEIDAYSIEDIKKYILKGSE